MENDFALWHTISFKIFVSWKRYDLEVEIFARKIGTFNLDFRCRIIIDQIQNVVLHVLVFLSHDCF